MWQILFFFAAATAASSDMISACRLSFTFYFFSFSPLFSVLLLLPFPLCLAAAAGLVFASFWLIFAFRVLNFVPKKKKTPKNRKRCEMTKSKKVEAKQPKLKKKMSVYFDVSAWFSCGDDCDVDAASLQPWFVSRFRLRGLLH